MAQHRRSRTWWEQQGYKADHPTHSETEFYVKGRDDAEAHALEQRNIDDGEDVRISVAPTRSSNPGRPRTVAMGYNYSADTLRVVFREGAVYDYFGVSTTEWWRMRRSASPGRFINRVLAQHEYTRIEN